jgi:hypothetical protein
MSERRYFQLSVTALVVAVIMALLGAQFESWSLLFNVLLAVIGLVAGFLINGYFAGKSEKQNLGKYASAGYRLSVDIHDSLNEILADIETMKSFGAGIQEATVDIVGYRFEIVAAKLRVLRRFALSANGQWRDVLPDSQLSELQKREKLIDLSEDSQLIISEERRLLKE